MVLPASRGGRGRGSWGPCYEGTHPVHESPTLMTQSPPKATPPNTIALRSGFPHRDSGDTDFQSIQHPGFWRAGGYLTRDGLLSGWGGPCPCPCPGWAVLEGTGKGVMLGQGPGHPTASLVGGAGAECHWAPQRWHCLPPGPPACPAGPGQTSPGNGVLMLVGGAGAGRTQLPRAVRKPLFLCGCRPGLGRCGAGRGSPGPGGWLQAGRRKPPGPTEEACSLRAELWAA